jgi:amino acid adenylation domain-containing protein
VVLAKQDQTGQKYLTGYVIPKGDYSKQKLQSYLQTKLPNYMIPEVWVELETIPLTPNGKIDKKALPDPQASHRQGEYVAPQNQTQQTLAEIWQDLLNIERVGISDNFFALGGHSLLAMRLVSSIRKELGQEIGVKELFTYPSIEELSDYLQTQTPTELLPPITKTPRPEHIPLSFSQERLWFIDKLEGSRHYHIPSVLKLKGNVNTKALQGAIKQIIQRHESLRTTIEQTQDQPYQRIHPAENWKLGIHDLTKTKDTEQELILKLINTPFNLEKDYMLRADLIQSQKQEYTLVVTLHHIASDGWSTSVMVREVVELYNAIDQKREPALQPLQIQYADYAIWQRAYLTKEILEKKLDYWKDKLEGTLALELTTDKVRPALQSTNGQSVGFSIDKTTTQALERLSQNKGATMFMTTLAAFKTLLYRYSGQSDICVGTPVAGRTHKETEDLIGYFINTLALRSEVEPTQSFEGLLESVRTTTLEAYAHQDVPFEKVIETVVKQRDLSRSPLFQVMFVYQNTPEVPQLKLGDVELSTRSTPNTKVKFELTLNLSQTPTGLRGSIQYCTDIYEQSTINRLIEHFKQLLESVVQTPKTAVGELNILSQQEEEQLLKTFNNTKTDYPKDKTIVDLFQTQANKTPNQTAVVYQDKHLTYKELNERSNLVAHYLQSKGVTTETLVPICIERSIEMIVGILGILKSGAAYVPIDPQYPQDRIDYMLEDTNAKLVLTDTASKQKLKSKNRELVDITKALPNDKQTNNLTLNNLTQNNLAYVIYTSGSTGRPKGVMIEHGNMYSFIHWCSQEFNSQSFDLAYAVTSMCFDLSVFEMFYPLTIGKPVRILENALYIEKYLKTDQNVLLNSVPSVVEGLLREGTDLSHITVMNMAGEPISAYVQQHVDTQNTEVRNLYGPSEDTTYSTIFRLEKGKPVTIGKPIHNTQIRILSKESDLLPIGVAGEICISGDGVARGYLNQPELTKEKFITDPFTQDRMYRTGDLGRWLEDGNIEYLGRIDDQVKIRGYRIELGEIEASIHQSGLTKQSVVLAKQDKEGNKRLVGYVVTKKKYTKESLLQFLRRKLPDYMIPALWIELEQLPMTPNGKIDKKALPEPDAEGDVKHYVAPQNQTQESLVEIWQRILGIERVGINDNFFELGGNSIVALRVWSNIMREFEIELEVIDLLKFPTIQMLSEMIDNKMNNH